MSLRAALGLGEDDVFDPSAPLKLYGIAVGAEAAEAADRLLAEPSAKRTRLVENVTEARPYLALQERSGLEAEICRLPPHDANENPNPWPTAAEIALVHCAQNLKEDEFQRVAGGEIGVCLYDEGFPNHYLELAETIRTAEAGPSNLRSDYSTITFRNDIESAFCTKVSNFLSQSFETKPIKYRFIEIYRIFESAYLRDAFEKFSSGFFADPEKSASTLSSTLKSERAQLYSLAEPHNKLFEDVADAFERCKKSGNKFSWAILRSMERKYKGDLEPKWKKGASIIYALRCAIVHAGEKDVVFESFEDGNEAIERVLPTLEIAALGLVGIEMI